MLRRGSNQEERQDQSAKSSRKCMQTFRPNRMVPAGTPRPREYYNTEMYNMRAWNNSPGLA